MASAICRSDMSLYYGDPVVGGAAAGTGTIVPGHEPAGIIQAVGPGVTALGPGDRVAIYLALGCRECEYCKTGFMMFCPSWKCIGFDVHGGNADYIVVPAANCMPIPDVMPFDIAAVSTDCIGTLYHAHKRLGTSARDTLVVFGIGPMGAAGVMIGRALNATVIAVDAVQERLELASQLGADAIVNAKEQDAVAAIQTLTAGRGASVVIDCTGNSTVQNQALDCAAPHGRVAFIGECKETTIKPSDQFIRKQLTVMGSWYFPIWEYDEIARFIVERRLPVEQLITHRFSIEDATEAFRLFDQRQTMKVVFTWN
jgi:propanol-preferring alcohol dehydrogenase